MANLACTQTLLRTRILLACAVAVAAAYVSGGVVQIAHAQGNVPPPEAKPAPGQQNAAPAPGQDKSAPNSNQAAPPSNAPPTENDLLADVGTVIPETTLGRARMRDNLYALLATAEDPKVAERIAKRIQQIWRVPGSATVALLIDRANRKIKAKQPDVAQKLLDAAVELAPDFAEAWHRRAFLNFERGNVRNAVGDLRRVLALDPNHYMALRGLASIMQELGNDGAALKAYERLLDVHPHFDGAQKSYDELKRKVDGQQL